MINIFYEIASDEYNSEQKPLSVAKLLCKLSFCYCINKVYSPKHTEISFDPIYKAVGKKPEKWLILPDIIDKFFAESNKCVFA